MRLYHTCATPCAQRLVSTLCSTLCSLPRSLSFAESLFAQAICTTPCEAFWKDADAADPEDRLTEDRLNHPFYENTFEICRQSIGAKLLANLGTILRLVKRGWVALKQCLPDDLGENLTIRRLSLECMDDVTLVDYHSLRFIRSLRGLAMLELDGCSIAASGIAALSDELRNGALPVLEQLYLGGNCLSGRHCLTPLAKVIREACVLSRLILLNLKLNQLDGGAFSEFVGGIGSEGLPQLKYLEVEECALGDADIEALADAGRAGGFCKLRRLGLRRNLFGDRAMIALASAAASYAFAELTHLECHDLTPGFGETAAEEFADCLASGRLPKLQRFVMTFSPLGNRGFAAIFRALALGKHPDFIEYHLHGTKATAEGYAPLLDSLKSLPSHPFPAGLEELSVGGNKCGDEVFGRIIDAIASGKLPRLKRLWLPNCRARADEPLARLALALKDGALVPYLQRAELNGNVIPEDVAHQFVEAVRVRPRSKNGDAIDVGSVVRASNQLAKMMPPTADAAPKSTIVPPPCAPGNEAKSSMEQEAERGPLQLLLGTFNMLGDVCADYLHYLRPITHHLQHARRAHFF